MKNTTILNQRIRFSRERPESQINPEEIDNESRKKIKPNYEKNSSNDEKIFSPTLHLLINLERLKHSDKESKNKKTRRLELKLESKDLSDFFEEGGRIKIDDEEYSKDNFEAKTTEIIDSIYQYFNEIQIKKEGTDSYNLSWKRIGAKDCSKEIKIYYKEYKDKFFPLNFAKKSERI